MNRSSINDAFKNASNFSELCKMTDMKSFPYDRLKRFVERDWAKVGCQYALITPCRNTMMVRYYSKSETKSYFDSAPRIKTVSKKHDPENGEATNETITYSPFFKRWSSDPTIRTLKEIYTDHSTTKSRHNCLNLWNGFLIEQHPLPEPAPDLSFILDHIKTLCGGEKERQLYEYVLNWLAHLVQKPGEKPETFLIVAGNQGVSSLILSKRSLVKMLLTVQPSSRKCLASLILASMANCSLSLTKAIHQMRTNTKKSSKILSMHHD